MFKTIILDCDDVILDWRLGFSLWMKAKGWEVTNPYPTDQRMLGAFPGKSWDEIRVEMPDFNRSPAFSRLSFLPDAPDGVAALRESFPDSTLVILTASGADPKTREMREINLAGLPFDHLIMLDLHGSKAEWLAQAVKPALFIDDHPRHAEAAANLGMTTLLFDRPWNRDHAHPAVTRISGWKAVIDLASGDLEADRAA